MRAQFGRSGLLIALGKSGGWLVCPAKRTILRVESARLHVESGLSATTRPLLGFLQ
jgi:hypothetical protein